MSDITYPTDRMIQAAGRIRANANDALGQHDRLWQRLQSSLNPLPGFIQNPILYVLNPYDKRLRESYQWQLDLADRLEQAAEIFQQEDQQIAGSF